VTDQDRVPGLGEIEAGLVEANERLGSALVEIGMALGLPRPTAQHHWGAAEILARIHEREHNHDHAERPGTDRPGGDPLDQAHTAVRAADYAADYAADDAAGHAVACGGGGCDVGEDASGEGWGR
jgi:hypothetical protein